MKPTRGLVVRLAAVVLLAAHAGLLLLSLRLHSVVVDEAAHIPAGLVHWHTGDYAAYRVNPPLPRMLATAPLLLAEHQWVGDSAEQADDPFRRSEWQIHKTFYQFNRQRYYDLVFLARLAGVAWSCLGGWLVFRWARELYGGAAGILALGLWCFEPNILTWGQFVTPDMPGAVAGLLAGYLFWQYVKLPIWPRAAGVGLALGLALLTKFTLLALLPVGLVILVIAKAPDKLSRSQWVGQRFGHAVLALALTLATINLGYLFEGTGKRLGDFPFISRTFAGVETDSRHGTEGAGNRFRGTWLGAVPVPVPEDWLRGIDVQRRDFEEMRTTRPSFLRGEWQDGGWWYYYLYALGVKLPVGTLVLILGGFGLAVVRARWSAGWRDELAVYLPALAILALVSSQTGFNHHMRYVLPALPFLLVGAGKCVSAFRSSEPDAPARVAAEPLLARRAREEIPLTLPSRPQSRGRGENNWRRRAGNTAVVALALWATVSSLRLYPHSMSYFNEFAGGPEDGHAHLVDSNIDWGQDVFFLKRWLDDHPEARPTRLAVMGFTQWDILGQEPLYPPSGL